MTKAAEAGIEYTITREQYFRHGFPLAVNRVHGHRTCPMHSHEFSELVVVLRGSGLHVTPHEDWPIGAGDVFVLQSSQAHGYENTDRLDLVNILYDGAELGLPAADVASLPGYHVLFTLEPMYRQRDRFESRLRLGPDDLRHVAALVDRLESELTARSPGWQFGAAACFQLIVCDLSRSYARVDAPAAAPLQRLGRVIGHLEQHYTEPLSLADLAQVACLSRRQLSRVFRQALGCTPLDYLIRLRLNRAVELLETTDESITDVAYQVGYEDSNYFTRQFRQVLGRSPREYRWGVRKGR